MHPSVAAVACGLLGILSATALASAVTIEWSPVGNAGNANDSADGDSGVAGVQNYGAVDHDYSIATKDVTVSQYVAFLNAKDPAGLNSLGLYNSNMSEPTNGAIQFNVGGAAGNKYSAVAGRANRPANYATWYSAIRFANWFSNGQGNSDTETGSYTLGAIGSGGIPITAPLTHNAGARAWLPTENEWYKAAFYNPTNATYYAFPTSSNSAPIASGPTALPNHANYNPGGTGSLTDVGAYSGTFSPYGALDMGGPVYQWTEALVTGTRRVVRGGNPFDPLEALLSSTRLDVISGYQGFEIGFRLASAVNSDFTGDGSIDGADFLLWQRQYGSPSVPAFAGADGDGDGMVSSADLNIWKHAFGSAARISSVPEPRGRCLLVLGFCVSVLLSRTAPDPGRESGS